MRVTIVAALCLGWVFAAPVPAAALTITNEGVETVNVWIENWLYRLRVGRSTQFHPSAEPARIVIESRHRRLSCEASADSEVRITEDSCIVDGVATGASQLQL